MTDLAAWIAEKRAASEGATEGPWRWIVNRKMREVALTGAKGVMRFSRWGMSEAAPMLIDATGNYCRVDEFIVPVAGREHHAAWHATIDHPDARHIAAFDPATTRRLLDCVEALDMLRRESKAYGGTSPAAEAAADAALDALGGGGE